MVGFIFLCMAFLAVSFLRVSKVEYQEMVCTNVAITVSVWVLTLSYGIAQM